MFPAWLEQWSRVWMWPWPRPLGARGERLAARHLRRRGYRLLARNVRNRYGEIDLVAETPDRRTLVIVEVKTGTGGRVRPEVHVNRSKQRQLINLATQLIRRHHLQDRPVRFDIVGVDLLPRVKPVIRHHRGAFQASSKPR